MDYHKFTTLARDFQEERRAKRYHQLFIDKIVINLPKAEIVGKTEAILVTLENRTAVRTDGVLTAVGSCLPRTYRCKNHRETVFVQQKQGVVATLANTIGSKPIGQNVFPACVC